MHSIIHSFIRFLIVGSLFFWLGLTRESRAEVVIIKNIHFGEFIIQNNHISYRLTINPDGSYMYPPSFIEINSPQPGIYEIKNLEPNSIINVTAVQIQPMMGRNNFFMLENFQLLHSNVDETGHASITLGADAVTSGNGSPYVDDTYSGQIQIQISF